MSEWVNTRDQRIKRRDGVYWARFSKRGRRVEESLETKNFELAKRQIEKMEALILMGRSWKRERQLFKDAWLEFLMDKKTGNKVRPIREKTLFEYSAFGARYYLKFFGEMRLSDIDDQTWLGFIKWVKETHGEVQFFNIRKYFQGFLTWAKRHEKILAPPYLFDPDGLKNKSKEEFTPGKAYTKEELKRIREASRGRGRFHLLVLMGQYMGMRPSEITQLQKDRINFTTNTIDLKRTDTKTNSSRRVPIHPLVLGPLKLQMSEGTSNYLFPNRSRPDAAMDRTGFKRVWSEVREAAQVEGRLYDFRHTFITHALADGLSPVIVAMITGTSINVIQKHYLHLSDTDLNQAIAKFSI